MIVEKKTTAVTRLLQRLQQPTLDDGILPDAASPTVLKRYLQTWGDFWDHAAERYKELDGDVVLRTYANAMAALLVPSSEGEFLCAAGDASCLLFRVLAT